jgi:hypothetical protein
MSESGNLWIFVGIDVFVHNHQPMLDAHFRNELKTKAHPPTMARGMRYRERKVGR